MLYPHPAFDIIMGVLQVILCPLYNRTKNLMPKSQIMIADQLLAFVLLIYAINLELWTNHNS